MEERGVIGMWPGVAVLSSPFALRALQADLDSMNLMCDAEHCHLGAPQIASHNEILLPSHWAGS